MANIFISILITLLSIILFGLVSSLIIVLLQEKKQKENRE